MLYPSPRNGCNTATVSHNINSYEDFLVEHVLNIPDTTPQNEDDDIERRLQIVQVEDFCFRKQVPDVVSHPLANDNHPLLNEFLHTSDYAEVIVPPPQG
jgi:hypothetical protein